MARGYQDDIKENETMNEIYVCRKCGQAVQGWHAAHEWYDRPCNDGTRQHDWVLDEPDQPVSELAKDAIRWTQQTRAKNPNLLW